MSAVFEKVDQWTVRAEGPCALMVHVYGHVDVAQAIRLFVLSHFFFPDTALPGSFLALLHPQVVPSTLKCIEIQ
jgi:hypothetical protein